MGTSGCWPGVLPCARLSQGGHSGRHVSEAGRALQTLFVTIPGCDGVIHSHTSPPKPSCFSSSRAGIGNLANPGRSAARKAAPTGPASGCHPKPFSVARPLVPLGALILHSQRLGAQRRAQGRIRALWASRERVQEAAPRRDWVLVT